MFDDWRKLRRLKKEIREIREHHEQRLRDVETDDELKALMEESGAKISPLECERQTLISDKVRADAAKFGVHVPSSSESPETWKKTGRYTPNTYLTSQSRARLTREISEARFLYWERWARLLVPILSLMVAIVALLKK